MPMLDPSAGTNPAQYTALLSTTLQNYQPQLVDNFSKATPAFFWFTQNERKRHLKGGTNIEVPLMYSGANVQSFSGYDKLDTAPVEGIAPATFQWKKYTAPIVISIDHETDNMSESAVINLLDAKVKQAEISFHEEMNFDLINNGFAGTGDQIAAPDPRKIIGLTDICQDSSQNRSYGGIDPGTYTWWQNQVGTLVTSWATSGTGGLDTMRSVYLDCSRGNDSPDLILTSQAGYEKYDASLVDNKRFVNTMTADAGFESLMFRGATIMFDRDVPAPHMYFLNSNYLTLFVHPDVDMKSSPFKETENQWARFSRIFWKGALTCSNRARQGLITNINLA